MTDPSSSRARSARTCARTGLRLLPAASQRTYRVAQTSYGPLAPPPRKPDFASVTTWGRWDSAGGRAIYSAKSPFFAYLEVLAYFRHSEGLEKLTLVKAFPESDDPDDHQETTVLEAIRKEWENKYAQWGPDRMTQRWREARGLYTIDLAAEGWYIDITHNDTIAALNRSGGPLGGPFHPSSRVTVANLVDEDRAWTCKVATLLRGIVLDDGSLPHGIRFTSKHGSKRRVLGYLAPPRR